MLAAREADAADRGRLRGRPSPTATRSRSRALLSGYAIDPAGLRPAPRAVARRSCALAGVGHGPANAAMLPHTIGGAAQRRAPATVDATARCGARAPRRGARGRRAAARHSASTEEQLEDCAHAAAQRAELAAHAAAGATRTRCRALYEAAW